MHRELIEKPMQQANSLVNTQKSGPKLKKMLKTLIGPDEL
jgi:hypothetical protein